MLDRLFEWIAGHPRSEWHVVERLRRVTLIDGAKADVGYVWGRKINGVWSYRELSADEYNTHLGEMAL
jgi:hypothetical protein